MEIKVSIFAKVNEVFGRLKMKIPSLRFLFAFLCFGVVCLAIAWKVAHLASAKVMTNGGMAAADFVGELPFVLPEVLGSLYQAYDEVSEERIYDRLAEVATGDALEDLYLERVRSLGRTGLDDSQEIHEIEIVSMSARVVKQAVNVSAEWRILGTVGHAEHMHMRGNAYTAEFVMEPHDDTWKISSFHLVNVDRSDVGSLGQHSEPTTVLPSANLVQP